MKAHELQERIDQKIKSLAEATDQALSSQAMVDFVKTMARFHRYSAQNVFSILLHNPDATRVAGYNAWNKMNRFVRRGEKGIPILAPLVTKGADGAADVKGFKVVYVFDISQTDGEPLPEMPDWKSPERQLELEGRLIALAESKGIQVERKPLQGSVQGVSRGGKIDLADEAGTKTLIHEIAHEILHQGKGKEKVGHVNEEIEAEAVAHIVGDYFGLAAPGSANYLALTGADGETVMQRLNRIRQCASAIITELEGAAIPTPELSLS